MMADEGVDNDEEYDEDIDESEQEDEETWNKLSTPQFKNGVELTTSTSTTPKTTESGSSTPSIIDPYFTHFDPRSEHQSYKVQYLTFVLLLSSLFPREKRIESMNCLIVHCRRPNNV